MVRYIYMTLINNNNDMQNTEWLIRYKQAGFSFFNTENSQKKVSKKWTIYQTVKPTDDEIKKWLDSPIQNYAIVCGEISGIIVIDVDPRNGGDPTPFKGRNFYEVATPSGGSHFYVKYNPFLASVTRKKVDGMLKGIDLQVDKKLAFAPPTQFPAGKYKLVNDAPIIDIPEDLLMQILDELEPEKESEEYTPYVPTKNPLMGRPGDIFNALASWDDVLIPNGWIKVGSSHKGVQYWKRPGKTDNYISASTNWNNYDLFFPYTTSISNLSPKKGYTKFNLYATLNHDGDYKKAASALVMENYKLAHKRI